MFRIGALRREISPAKYGGDGVHAIISKWYARCEALGMQNPGSSNSAENVEMRARARLFEHGRARRIFHTLSALVASVGVGIFGGAASCRTRSGRSERSTRRAGDAERRARRAFRKWKLVAASARQRKTHRAHRWWSRAVDVRARVSKRDVEPTRGKLSLACRRRRDRHGFAYWNGEEKIVGEVFERESAQKVYEALTGLKKDPGLLEQTGEGAFAFRVFPIEPNDQKRVQVSTSHWMERRGRAIEFRARVARADAQVSFDVNDARGVNAITSTTHDIDVSASRRPNHV